MYIEIAKIIGALLIALWGSGCGMSRGWEFRIGINPLTETTTQQKLSQYNTLKVKE